MLIDCYDIPVPGSYTQEQIEIVKDAVLTECEAIEFKKRERKVASKVLNNNNIIPEENRDLFQEAVDYFEGFELQPRLIRASLSVKIQLDKTIRNLITFRLPRWSKGEIYGGLYFNCIKLETDIVKLAIYDYDIKKDSIGSYKISRISLNEMLELLTKERINMLFVSAKRLDSEYRYNCRKRKL